MTQTQDHAADTTAGAVLAQTFVAMPFLVVTAEAAFRGADRRYEDAARSLGVRLAAAAVIMGLAGFNGFSPRFFIHVSQHQNLARFRILGNGWNKPPTFFKIWNQYLFRVTHGKSP